jgi:hypothetical protein
MNGSGQESTHRAIERVARESYGRLVAYLSSHTRDVASAEDALSNALVTALKAWPGDGVPQNPDRNRHLSPSVNTSRLLITYPHVPI